MKKLLMVTVIALSLGLMSYQAAGAQEIKAEDCFFLSSLHYTAKGMEHWYSKEQGGLETITGIPYSELGCKRCHTAGCDRCHKEEKECGPVYSTQAASSQGMCLKCHGRERAIIAIDHEANQDDVHLAMGMVCTDCHGGDDLHGDGVKYVSLKQPGAVKTQCEDCHASVKPIEAHLVHDDKLDCKACHLRHVVSCTNCHFDTLVEKGKRFAMPVSGWLFLMNHDGKVSSASMQTFVTNGNDTFLLFAPHMSHSVMKEGRDCNSCHGTKTMKQAKTGDLNLTFLEGGELENLKGVIPVVDSVNYHCVYFDREDGEWVKIKNPAEPLRQYAAFGNPLTQEQLESLAQAMKTPPPKME